MQLHADSTTRFARLDLANGFTVWFSYATPIAFQAPGGPRVVRHNDWSNTTGKHLNKIDGGDKDSRYPSEVFERKLSDALKKYCGQ